MSDTGMQLDHRLLDLSFKAVCQIHMKIIDGTTNINVLSEKVDHLIEQIEK